MDNDAIVQLVGSLGFPIAAFMLMYRMVITTIEEHTKAIREMTMMIVELREMLKSRTT